MNAVQYANVHTFEMGRAAALVATATPEDFASGRLAERMAALVPTPARQALLAAHQEMTDAHARAATTGTIVQLRASFAADLAALTEQVEAETKAILAKHAEALDAAEAEMHAAARRRQHQQH